MKRIFAGLLSLLCLMADGTSAQAAGAPKISAASAILIDAASGRVLYEHNAHEKRLIASITKLMTALVAVESMPDLTQRVEIKREYTLAEGSSMYLKTGEQISLEELLYGLLMSSGNDAALAVAGGCAGDVDTFVDWMNQRAASIGMKDTHFANPSGLNEEAHYSTAADMAKLARVVMEHPVLANIVGTKSITIAGRSLVNHNKLLWRYEGCVGMKTGYTKKAGRTLVSCAERDGQRLIVVTLNDPDDWSDHAALFDYGFSCYPEHTLARAGKIVQTVPVEGSLSRFIPVETASDVRYPLTSSEQVKAKIVLPEKVQAPLLAGEIAGRLTFSLDGNPIGETYLVYAQSMGEDVIQEKSLFQRFIDFVNGGNHAAFAWRELFWRE